MLEKVKTKNLNESAGRLLFLYRKTSIQIVATAEEKVDRAIVQKKQSLALKIALSADLQDEDESSLSLKLLADIKVVFEGERMTSKEFLNALREEEESLWSYLQSFNLHFLARMMKDFGIQQKPFGVER